MADCLSKQGVPLEDLKTSVAEKQGERFTRSWADATEAFKSRHPEWVGGDANRDLIGQIIAENNLLDTDPLEALEAAYSHAKENGSWSPTPRLRQQNRWTK